MLPSRTGSLFSSSAWQLLLLTGQAPPWFLIGQTRVSLWHRPAVWTVPSVLSPGARQLLSVGSVSCLHVEAVFTT